MTGIIRDPWEPHLYYTKAEVDAIVAEIEGQIPAPLTVDLPLVKEGDNLSINAASGASRGTMSAADFTKLAAIPADAQSAAQVTTIVTSILTTALATLRGFWTTPLNFLGNAAAVVRYANFSAITTPVGYNLPAGRIKRLVAHSWLNTLAASQDTVYEIYKNQVATGVTVTLLATDPPFTNKGVDCDIAWTADDQIDIKGTLAANSTSGSLSTQVTVYISPPDPP